MMRAHVYSIGTLTVCPTCQRVLTGKECTKAPCGEVSQEFPLTTGALSTA
jgi:hypothetical protein